LYRSGNNPWSLEAAAKVRAKPNARFIVLDPNGEYCKSFDDLPGGARIMRVPAAADHNAELLTMPAWMWNSHEWAAFVEAAPRVQRPMLIRALRELRTGESNVGGTSDLKVLQRLRVYRLGFANLAQSGAFVAFPQTKSACERLVAMSRDLQEMGSHCDATLAERLNELAERSASLADAHKSEYRTGSYDYAPFTFQDFQELGNEMASVLQDLGARYVESTSVGAEDHPIRFDVADLASHIELIAESELSGTASNVETLVMRIRGLLSDTRKRDILYPDPDPSLDEWLEQFLSTADSSASVTVLDLSLMPHDVMHTFIASFARIVFEAMQRYRRASAGAETVPTVLVLEEAHSFLRRGRQQDDGPPTPEVACREAFERIAREGRKFGLGLVLSSQRPSEISETVLSQCNTFILHRIVSDRDQDLVGRMAQTASEESYGSFPTCRPEGQLHLAGRSLSRCFSTCGNSKTSTAPNRATQNSGPSGPATGRGARVLEDSHRAVAHQSGRTSSRRGRGGRG